MFSKKEFKSLLTHHGFYIRTIHGIGLEYGLSEIPIIKKYLSGTRESVKNNQINYISCHRTISEIDEIVVRERSIFKSFLKDVLLKEKTDTFLKRISVAFLRSFSSNLMIAICQPKKKPEESNME